MFIPIFINMKSTLKNIIKEEIKSILKEGTYKLVVYVESDWEMAKSKVIGDKFKSDLDDYSILGNKIIYKGDLSILNKIKSLLQFKTPNITRNEIKEDVLKEDFYRAPFKKVADLLYIHRSTINDIYSDLNKGNDYKYSDIDKMIKDLKKVQSLSKKFKSGDTVPEEYM